MTLILSETPSKAIGTTSHPYRNYRGVHSGRFRGHLGDWPSARAASAGQDSHQVRVLRASLVPYLFVSPFCCVPCTREGLLLRACSVFWGAAYGTFIKFKFYDGV